VPPPPLRAPLLALLLLAAACGGRDDDGRGEIPPDRARVLDEEGRPLPTPAESAAVAHAVREHSRRIHDEARRQGGHPDLDRPPLLAPPAAAPAPRNYAECVAQAARSPNEEERAALEGICPRLPGAP
jgi:hypothetical protein